MKNNGEVILETLKAKKMTQARARVTKKTADKIEKVLGIQLSVTTK